MVNFIGVSDDDEVVFAFDLTAGELAGKGSDVQVGSIATSLVEEGLHVERLLVGDDVPSPELLEYCRNGLVFVVNIVFGEFFNVLVVDSTGDGFNAD